MVQSKLPFPESEFVPSDEYDEPAVWLRCLILVESPEPPVRIIRRVTFRRGLNIVCTEPRLVEDKKPVGHSVGKSLMVRIIRYCLGENRFCTDSQRAAIAAKLERGYVFALLRVGGEDWAVARPIGLESGSGESWCVRSTKLHDLIDDEHRLKYREFVDAVGDATSKCYAEIDLPRASRRANWRDLLGWLSRDQDCHFDHQAEWREPELHAGPRALALEDAYLVMRMALGLLGPDEIGLLEHHRGLLEKKRKAEELVRQYEAYLSQAEARLRSAVDELSEQPPGEMFGAAFVNVAEQKIASLTELLDDPDVLNRDELNDLQDALTASLRNEGTLEERLRQLSVQYDSVAAELENAQEHDSSTLLQQLGGLRWKCSYFKTKGEAMDAGCPGKRMVDQGIADPWRKQRIKDLQEELDAIGQQRDAIRSDVEVARQNTTQHRRALAEKTRDYVRIRSDVTSEIGRWTARKDEAERYSSAWRDLRAIQNGRDARQKKIDESLDALRQARTKFEQQKARISEFYDAVLRRTISPLAEGRIEVDGDGVRPVSNDVVADSGTTLREYAGVLSFDLACLAAGICGTGYLPRLWIHDSPRQADSEEQLYFSVLELISELERAFPEGRRPSFQYILTTTSPPPAHLNTSPFVRARLHARTEKGKLLRREFGK